MGRKVARESDRRRWGWDLGLRRILPGLQDGELVVRLDSCHTILCCHSLFHKVAPNVRLIRCNPAAAPVCFYLPLAPAPHKARLSERAKKRLAPGFVSISISSLDQSTGSSEADGKS